MNTSIVTLFEILCGVVLGYFIIQVTVTDKVNFEDFALGSETRSYYAEANAFPIHVGELSLNKIDSLKIGWEKRGKKPLTLILGNSQTHGINQYEEGQETYNALLFNQYQKSEDFICQSIPNANLQEFYLSFEFWISNFPIKRVLIPVFMDDTREDGIRENYYKELASSNFKIDESNQTSININIDLGDIKNAHSNNLQNEGTGFKSLEQTFQDKSEHFLNEFISDHTDVWDKRETLRGDIFTNLYLLRNTILNISAETKRKMIPERYHKNLMALKSLLVSANKNNIEVLVYIPPIRNDVGVPYILTEYEEFKHEIEDLVIEFDNPTIKFMNFEDIVPAEFWGVKTATKLLGKDELDFMHFQYEGHMLLFNELSKVLNSKEQ